MVAHENPYEDKIDRILNFYGWRTSLMRAEA